jgi:hypothetical protein
MSNKPYYSIISGELAHSNKVPRDLLAKIPDIIRSSLQAVNKHKDRADRIDFEIIRMDEFLAMIETPQTALHSILMFASQFRYETYKELGIRTELRLSMSVGPIEYARKELRESDGTAFREAAAGLRVMKRNQRLSITTQESAINDEFKVSCGFMDILIHNWSDEQAEALFHCLSGKNQVKISEELNISQPAVNRRLKAANWDATERFIKRYETLIH